jgi:hypothetical protein
MKALRSIVEIASTRATQIRPERCPGSARVCGPARPVLGCHPRTGSRPVRLSRRRERASDHGPCPGCLAAVVLPDRPARARPGTLAFADSIMRHGSKPD